MASLPSHPILSCAEAARFEESLFGGDESLQWAAMLDAGSGVASAVMSDFAEIGDFPAGGRLLVLAGKGNNGGDALIAAGEILKRHPGARADVVLAYGERTLRPLARRAWQQLTRNAGGRAAHLIPAGSPAGYDVCLDGVFGFQFRPPLDRVAAGVLRWANRIPVRLRAAVDLPSGLNERAAFRADFTYATGILKSPVLGCSNAGRLRYVDLGFFDRADKPPPTGSSNEFILTPAMLAPLGALRSPFTDKRSYGHLCLFGGSRDFPGAILMAVLAALRSGAGLVTAHVPASLAPAFAARAPEAMWVAWPETPDGSLALETPVRLRARLERADALVIGPGLGRNPESLALVSSLVKASRVPVLLDADALQPEIVRAAKAPLILTPHAGEFARIACGADLRTYCSRTGATVVLKGPVTKVAWAGRDKGRDLRVYHSLFGGPVLARGGSGDMLSGLTGGLLAQTPRDRLLAACRGVIWHGLAADLLARAHGQTAVSGTQLLDFLPAVLRTVAIT
jgi:ADP-dependent NAD(P)H-hydrate dehydratase / NAD(P)H-hydrate epimerase